jgi:inositol-phosphate transport system substrate-binding protein
MKHWTRGTLALLTAALLSAPALAQTTITYELWSRADPSGPLRPGNVVKAAERLNAELEAEKSDKRVAVTVRESPAGGFDEDALQLLKVFGINEGPDMFIQAHEWICAFQEEGFVLKLDDYIAKYPEHYGTIFPSLWESGKCPDGIYGIPQDAEARMFFYNKNLLRKAGYDDAFIEGFPDAVLKGEITMDDILDIAKKVVDSGAEYGILHRPSKGPDYLMVFQTYGNTFVDESGKLMLERDKLAAAFGWFERGVKSGVIAANNTSMEWNDIRAKFYQGNAAFPRQRRLPDLRHPVRRGELLEGLGLGCVPAGREGRRAVEPDASDHLRDRRRRRGAGPRGTADGARLCGRPQHRSCGHDDPYRHQAGAA